MEYLLKINFVITYMAFLRIAEEMTKAFIENKNVCLTNHLHIYRRPDFCRYIFEKAKKAQGIKYS